MFGFLKKKKPSAPKVSPLYDGLFGDVPLEGCDRAFDAVRAALSDKDKPRALQRLRELLADNSQQHLQAWHCMRELGVQPGAAEAKQVLGIVLEVALPTGHDTLAAYRDYSAKLSSHTGKVIEWASRDPQVDAHIEQLLAAGQRLAEKLGLWTEPRHPPPSDGNVRVTLLTPSGLRCCEGPFAALAPDPSTGPIVTSGAKLMGALVGRAAC